MKKAIIKAFVFIIVFIVTLFGTAILLNKNQNNMTTEMAAPTLPILSMEINGTYYNELHGYTTDMDVAFQRDSITVLGEERDTLFCVSTFGRNVTGIQVEIRSADGKRLIESSPVTDYGYQDDRIYGKLVLKDLLERDTEYALTILLQLEDETVRYYTRAIWSDTRYLSEKLSYVLDFHNRLYDKEAARELTKYLETNSRLQDNRSFHYVNIHSSFAQLTWGDLKVLETKKPVITVKELGTQTASIILDYQVSTAGEGRNILYRAKEYFQIRYTPTRTYLLNYERTMTQLADVEHMCVNNKIVLGIDTEDVPMIESGDGNILAFETGNRLFTYNAATNKLAALFGFYDERYQDARSVYDQHGIKLLDVDEGGNICFAVYGYMNRGKHEGRSGISIYLFQPDYNTVEELSFIPYKKPYSVLKVQMEELLYVNLEGQLYFTLDSVVYHVDLASQNSTPLVELNQDGELYVSENHEIFVYKKADAAEKSRQLDLYNLRTGVESQVTVSSQESVKPLGFMGEDIIYGVARNEDILTQNAEDDFFPMYKVCICSTDGTLLKSYEQENIYILSCSMEDNQIILKRMLRREDGTYVQTSDDHILTSDSKEAGKNYVVCADIDLYKRYVQIQVRKEIDTKSLQLLTPKEVLLEGQRNIETKDNIVPNLYYVYGAYGVLDITYSASSAVSRAYEDFAVVVDANGREIFKRGNRVARNQIMAIKEPNEKTNAGDSVAACLDAMLKHRGIVGNSSELLAEGASVLEVLSEYLPDLTILDLRNCPLDAVLYYVNQDIPVLARLNNGEAVLLTGFNEQNVVIFDPSTKALYKKGMNDTKKWLADNGNCFYTYLELP